MTTLPPLTVHLDGLTSPVHSLTWLADCVHREESVRLCAVSQGPYVVLLVLCQVLCWPVQAAATDHPQSLEAGMLKFLVYLTGDLSQRCCLLAVSSVLS